MKEIREYYEPLVNAAEKYKAIEEEILIKENFLKYCEEVLNKKQKKKKFKKIVKLNKKEKQDAWSLVKSANASYLGFAGLILIILFLSGVLGIGLKIFLILLFGIGFGGVNAYFIPSAIKEELEYRYLANYLGELDDKDVELNKVKRKITVELPGLREKRNFIAIYLAEYQGALKKQENEVANEILVKNGIDANIDVTIKRETGTESIKNTVRMLVLKNLFKD